MTTSTKDSKMAKGSQEVVQAYLQNIESSENQSEDYEYFTFMASDNLINFSYRKWSTEILNQMAKNHANIPLILNHEWDAVETTLGYCTKSWIEKSENLPNSYSQVPGMEKFNKKIVEKEGLHNLYLKFAVPKHLELEIKHLKTGIYNFVSTGGLLLKPEFVCPNCTELRGEKTTFTQKDKKGNYVCPHAMPHPWLFQYFDEDELADMEIADYVIIDGDYSPSELSLVVAGNYPSAKKVDK